MYHQNATMRALKALSATPIMLTRTRGGNSANNKNIDNRKRLAEVEQSRNRTTDQARDRTTDQVNFSFNAEHIFINFDGATKENGTINANSSIGVFLISYENPYCLSRLCSAKSNNASEITAAINAVQTATLINDNHNIKRFTIRGDSAHVICCINDNRIKTYQAHDHYPNSALWVELREKISIAAAAGIETIWEWVPRCQNREADQLANVAISKAAIDPNIKSDFTYNLTSELLVNALAAINKRRHPTIRTLPASLTKLWAPTVAAVLRHAPNPTHLRYVFLLLPHLLSIDTYNVRGRQDFTKLRDHLLMLQDMQYVAQCCERLVHRGSDEGLRPRESNQSSERKRVHTLVQRNLLHKTIADDDITVAKSAQHLITQIENLFPQSELPDPLPISEDCYNDFLFGDILMATRRLGRGKGVGLSGWSRELLLPVLKAAPVQLQEQFRSIFNSYTNCADLTDLERELLLNGILVPLTYKSKPDKIRPITILDTVTKICWNLVLKDKADAMLDNSSHTSHRKGGCQLAIHTVQEALAAGAPVIGLDAINAFNTIDRRAGFEYLQAHRTIYKKAFLLINFYYAQPTFATWFDNESPFHRFTITTGARQGCISSMWFYTICTLRTNNKWKSSIVQVADDVYIFKDALNIADAIIEDFSNIGQKLDGPKARLICSSKTPIQRDQLPSRLRFITDILSSPTPLLGGYVTPDWTQPIPHDLLLPWTTKVEKKYARLKELDASKQDKLLIIKSLSHNFLYHAETFLLPHQLRCDVFCQIDIIQQNTFNAIFPGPPLTPAETQNRHVQIHTPLEDGGFNLIPYEHIHSMLLSNSQRRAAAFLPRFDMRQTMNEAPDPEQPIQTLKAQWVHSIREKHVAMRLQHGTASRAAFQRVPSLTRSWQEILPSNRINTLTDEEVEFAIQLQLQQLPPHQGKCKGDDTELAHLRPEVYTRHMLTCKYCGAKNFHHRHEAINNMLQRTLKFHGYNTVLNPREFPIPGKTRGGPDLLVDVRSKTYAIDVAVTILDKAETIFARKMHHYKSFAETTKFITLPFVTTVNGSLCARTIELLKELWYYPYPDIDVREDLLSNFQFSLIRGIKIGIDLFHSQQKWAATIPNYDQVVSQSDWAPDLMREQE
jgi:ribonuclease HI